MIRGDKVALRALEETDLEALHQWMNDLEVTKYLGMRFPVSLSDERRWLETEHDPLKELHLAIETHEGKLIGSCGLVSINHLNGWAILGISIGDKEYWNGGYGTDAMLTLCGFGFNQCNLHRIQLDVFAENARAIRCYEKVGFVHEGRRREAIFRHGRYQDLIVMGLLAEEYREKWPERWGG
ncbi:MAG: GNAT family protein [Armatimonadia bacterium]